MDIPNKEQKEHHWRANRVSMPFWTTPAARRQLRIMAAEEDTTQQKLIAEALNLLFADRNRDQCALVDPTGSKLGAAQNVRKIAR